MENSSHSQSLDSHPWLSCFLAYPNRQLSLYVWMIFRSWKQAVAFFALQDEINGSCVEQSDHTNTHNSCPERSDLRSDPVGMVKEHQESTESNSLVTSHHVGGLAASSHNQQGVHLKTARENELLHENHVLMMAFQKSTRKLYCLRHQVESAREGQEAYKKMLEACTQSSSEKLLLYSINLELTLAPWVCKKSGLMLSQILVLPAEVWWAPCKPQDYHRWATEKKSYFAGSLWNLQAGSWNKVQAQTCFQILEYWRHKMLLNIQWLTFIPQGAWCPENRILAGFIRGRTWTEASDQRQKGSRR